MLPIVVVIKRNTSSKQPIAFFSIENRITYFFVANRNGYLCPRFIIQTVLYSIVNLLQPTTLPVVTKIVGLNLFSPSWHYLFRVHPKLSTLFHQCFISRLNPNPSFSIFTIPFTYSIQSKHL